MLQKSYILNAGSSYNCNIHSLIFQQRVISSKSITIYFGTWWTTLNFVNESRHLKLQFLEISIKWHSVYKSEQGKYYEEVLVMLFLDYEYVWNLFTAEGQNLLSESSSSLATAWINGGDSSLSRKGVCSQIQMEVGAHISKG